MIINEDKTDHVLHTLNFVWPDESARKADGVRFDFGVPVGQDTIG
jgi:hypothetical protein